MDNQLIPMKTKDIIILTLGLIAGIGAIAASYPSEQKTLATVLVLEAGGEGERGMKIVASVLQNRAAARGTKPIQEALRAGQFSSLKQGLSRAALIAENDPRFKKSWYKAMKIAADLQAGKHIDTTNGANYFATKTPLKKGTSIGNITFWKGNYK